MCGITGVWGAAPRSAEELRALAERMRDTLTHRGPDDWGYWSDRSIAFGHRRLAILDLSREGHQPMTSADGRYVICYNGEVYNFQELQRNLRERGHRFRGHSDTEVMLAAVVEWGLVEAVRQFVGMFAFALWDTRERVLHLVRDRVGVKPLYVGRAADGDLLFGSELKALVAHPSFQRRIDGDALAAYLRYTYVPAPRTIFRDAVKLVPGHILTLRSPADSLTDSQPYWSVADIARDGASRPFVGDERDAVDALDASLREAVAARMIADVPLGAFLSGGIDSSTVVALMQAQSPTPIRTFTIGFREGRFDESAHAARIARHLETEHTSLTVTEREALDVIPVLPDMYDEPFADVSQIPTHLVSRLAREHVTVSLSGDGGDELFAGYARYKRGSRWWGAMSHAPAVVRRGTVAALGSWPLRTVSRSVGRMLGKPGIHGRLHRLAALAGAAVDGEVYATLMTAAGWSGDLLSASSYGPDPLAPLVTNGPRPALVERMMLADTAVYLPDDLLVKLDRASMAVSLEGRVPLLDHRVVELAWRLPLEVKLRGKQTKWLLKQVLERYMPRSLFEREKMGFEVPVDVWLRGSLREWAGDLLTADHARSGGFIAPRSVATLWDDHQSGRASAGHALWAIVMFLAWCQRWHPA